MFNFFNYRIVFGIKEFLLLDEMAARPSIRGGHPPRQLTRLLQSQNSSSAAKIELNNVSVKWPVVLSENEESTITNASLKIGPGQLLTVVGSVGSGKV